MFLLFHYKPFSPLGVLCHCSEYCKMKGFKFSLLSVRNSIIDVWSFHFVKKAINLNISDFLCVLLKYDYWFHIDLSAILETWNRLQCDSCSLATYNLNFKFCWEVLRSSELLWKNTLQFWFGFGKILDAKLFEAFFTPNQKQFQDLVAPWLFYLIIVDSNENK